MLDNIEIAREVLREMNISYNINGSFKDEFDYYEIQTDEDHIVNAMLVFLERVNNKRKRNR